MKKMKKCHLIKKVILVIMILHFMNSCSVSPLVHYTQPIDSYKKIAVFPFLVVKNNYVGVFNYILPINEYQEPLSYSFDSGYSQYFTNLIEVDRNNSIIFHMPESDYGQYSTLELLKYLKKINQDTIYDAFLSATIIESFSCKKTIFGGNEFFLIKRKTQINVILSSCKDGEEIFSADITIENESNDKDEALIFDEVKKLTKKGLKKIAHKWPKPSLSKEK